MKKMIIFVGIFVLTSCAQRQVVWDKYGATQNQFAQDQFACEKASQITIPGRPYQAPPSQMVSGQYVAPSWSQQLNAVVASNPSVRIDEGAFVNCMQSKGYQGRYK